MSSGRTSWPSSGTTCRSISRRKPMSPSSLRLASIASWVRVLGLPRAPLDLCPSPSRSSGNSSTLRMPVSLRRAHQAVSVQPVADDRAAAVLLVQGGKYVSPEPAGALVAVLLGADPIQVLHVVRNNERGPVLPV